MSFNIETEIVLPGLIHLHFDNQYEITSSFLRLQEFYESSYPEIRGHLFTLEQYMDRYAKDKGNFTYTSDWSGFNVPGNVVAEFWSLFSSSLLEKEKRLLRLILDTSKKYDFDKYYVIASSRDSGNHTSALDVMRHEIAHGMWYLNSKYQKKQRTNVDTINREYPEFGATLLQMGYCKEVIDDELQAYFSTSSMTYLADDAFEDWEIPWDLVLQCQRTFEEFYEKLSDTDEEL